MAIIKTRRTINFTTLPNELINDPRLRWADLGLLVYLLSKPDTWAVRVDVLVKERGIGRDAVYEILKRLREHGYAKVVKFSDGKTEWTIYDNPNTDIQDEACPNTENPDQENPDQDNPHQYKRKSISKERIIEKKDRTLTQFLSDCKTENQSPIPDDDPVFKYAKSVGIPHDFLWLAWFEFKKIFTDPNRKEFNKKYKSWPQAFKNYVSGNFLRIWYIDSEGNYSLTTSGKQLQREAA